MHHPSVLIVAQEPAVARDIVSRWQAESVVPSFTLMSTDFPRVEGLGKFDLAIIQTQNGHARQWEEAVDSMAETVLHLAAKAPSRHGHDKIFVPHAGDWLATTVLVGSEMLRRVEMARRLRKLEGSVGSSEHHASLGQYMLEARHGFNNALTSVLGNAELLMLSIDRLPLEAREQVETVHAMALKLYEMMQRFSSIEAEMRFEQKGKTKLVSRPRSAAYGS